MPCSLGAKPPFFETAHQPKRKGRDGESNKEPDMKTYFDDIATAIVVLTYGVAAVSAVFAVFAGSI
jgi:hypothetical protein